MLRRCGFLRSSAAARLCALTGVKIHNEAEWQRHVATPEYKFRALLAERLTSATPLPMKDLWKHVTTETKMIDEFQSERRSQRIGHLSTSLKFLRDHNVLLHSGLHFNPATQTWNVTAEFDRVLIAGDTFLQREVAVRLFKLLPTLDDETLSFLVTEVCSVSNLSSVFDRANLSRNVDPSGRRRQKLTAQQKAASIVSTLGELHWFVVKTKATDRTHNNALFPPSDVLVLHVLSAHCCEALCGELIVERLMPAMRAFKLQWKNVGESLPQQLKGFKPRVPGAFLLNSSPLLPPPQGESSAERSVARLAGPSPVPTVGALRARQGARLGWKRMDALDVTKTFSPPLAAQPSK